MIHTNKPLHLIGFGGAGANSIIAIQKMGLPAKYTCITQPERKDLAPEITCITFMPPGERRITKTGKEFFIPNRQAPLEVPKTIDDLFEPNAHYVIIAGLGGYTGTYLMKHFGSRLQDNQKSFTAICILPFSFERRASKAIINQIHQKYKAAENFHFIDLNTYQEKFGDKPITELFDQVNQDVYSLIKL